ncbi:hypothetical protein, conserved [Leishmania tarentolae]|uniref:Uncharacterized protein n=1 Tax=Leishmania tarentolae TaxID=5689 RepID=A0A640KD55_LEITA|nr:hypothetical protein, conserved [Leishmania tarentolae]
MNIYTSDGLLVSRGADTDELTTAQGQQLISIYRLFLQLHHAGTGTMRIKDMLKPETTDAVSEHGGGGASGDKNADRRGGGAGRGGAGAANVNWSSIMPESTAYTSSIAAVSAGTPYPIFLLSSNAIPETHRLRGFASAVVPQQLHQHATTAGTVATTCTKNNNRSANGCEEISLRWSLLTKQLPPCPTVAVVSSAAGSTTGASAGTPASMAATVNTTAATTTTAETAAGVPVERTDVAGVPRSSMPNAKSAGNVASAAASLARIAAPTLCAYPSGWTAAQLQVHTTKQVMVCTSTEVSLDSDGSAEDGNAPLLFCCSAQRTSGSSPSSRSAYA